MHSKYLLEVCAYNLHSCIVAEKAGAARIELCADPLQGGTTPSYGLIKQARERITLPLYPIIRPREGDFCYTDDEINILMDDINICKELGCDGISTGVLLRNGKIDAEQMNRIVDFAYPMSVTCHRAFDLTPDVFRALEDVIATGCIRILTSGQKAKAVDGMDALTALVKAAGDRISIMPGGGVRSSNIEMFKKTGAMEFHTSARISQAAIASGDLLGLGNFCMADEGEIKQIIAGL